ncbi:hypothetical protein E2C01_070347 [Portunus trituberculatus]|uniref:Uncharacterized protein n=1 Tax=Portunus trituberculatus TaxID=210409 RepID=A0A5B7I1V0_PORTR|nr:hypothetical protein [Portunus trituberculatus]
MMKVKSPPVADDAETEGATVLEGECGKDPELSDAQLSRPLPPSGSTIQTKVVVINGHIGTAQTKPLPNAAPKRTVCTRSQALKELQLQSSTAALSNGVKSSNSSSILKCLQQCQPPPLLPHPLHWQQMIALALIQDHQLPTKSRP